MMSDPMIDVRNLSKRYTLGREKGGGRLTETITDTLSHPIDAIKKATAKKEEFWALKDVSFTVEKGDVVGIIGKNGAGKSTLLKILTQITPPTTGTIVLGGRVASLLEVGTGFHADLTGRENIYLNGAILGMKRGEIDAKFDEIVKFADIGKFLDTPVKRYSSGMYVRLAFAVAAHLEPEILLVDEVLAVGDAQFQKKCLGKMKDVSEAGRTVLFVSHNMGAVKNLCNRGILLRSGEVLLDTDIEEAVNKYINTAMQEVADKKEWVESNIAPGNDIIRLKKIRIHSLNKSPPNISIRDPFQIEMEYWNLKPDIHLSIAMHIKTIDDITVFSTNTWRDTEWKDKPFNVGLYQSICKIPGDILNEGPYKIRLLFVSNSSSVVCEFNDILTFGLLDSNFDKVDWHGKYPGVVRPLFDWSTIRINKSEIQKDGET